MTDATEWIRKVPMTCPQCGETHNLFFVRMAHPYRNATHIAYCREANGYIFRDFDAEESGT